MQAKLITNFERLNEPAFKDKGKLICTSLTGNVYFPIPWATNTVEPSVLTMLFGAYETAATDAAGGDTAKIALRIAARETITGAFKANAPYLELVAAGNVAMLETTGYDLRHDSHVHTTPDTLPAPTGFTVARGTLSGTLNVGCDALHGAGGFKCQICTGDPTVEANWKDAASFKNCSHNVLTGQTPGQMVSVRLCGIGAKGLGAWTNAISLMVV